MKKVRRYTVSFIFTPDLGNVWLMEKQKPDWQKGFYNGIGDKIDGGESIIGSVKRKIYEEYGILIENLIRVGELNGLNINGERFCETIFKVVSDKRLETKGIEKIELVKLSNLLCYNLINNIKLLLEACLLKINQPKMNCITISYK